MDEFAGQDIAGLNNDALGNHGQILPTSLQVKQRWPSNRSLLTSNLSTSEEFVCFDSNMKLLSVQLVLYSLALVVVGCRKFRRLSQSNSTNYVHE